MDTLERLVAMAVRLLDALAGLLSGIPSLLLAVLGIGGLLLWWRAVLLRQKRVEAALLVLEALDRVREAFHTARRQELAMAPAVHRRDSAKWREAQMVALQGESRRMLRNLHAARDGLLAAQARAVALWGDAAKRPFEKVYSYVDMLTTSSQRYFPGAIRRARVMDAGLGHPSLELPQPTGIMYGHENDEYGRRFDEAIRDAVTLYERKRGRARD